MRAPRSLARLTRLARLAPLAAVVVLSLGGLTACGGDGDEPEDDSSQAAEEGGDDGGDEGADPAGDDEAATAGFADCSAISAEEMAAVLGEGTGTAEVPPGGGGCSYALDDPTLPSVLLEELGTDDFADGFEGARANITNTAVGPLEGATTTSVDGVGDGAEIAVGASPLGGESLTSIGLVLVGDTVVRASTLQAVGLDEAAMTELTTDILTLVASKA